MSLTLCERERGQTEDSAEDVDSRSMTRILELGVKSGFARHESHIGKTRGLINQHRTGTISRHVLADILRRRSECLWTCFTCNDGDPMFN